MTDITVKIIRCFELAKSVNHHYWVHTPDASQNMRVENIERIVSWMQGVRLPVEKWVVPYDDATFIRGLFERYDDRIVIYIRDGQTPEWVRFTIVKELCHALIDEPGDFSPKGEETIRDLIKYHGVTLDEISSAVLHSERLAEITALELIYPLEFRRADVAAISAGVKIPELVQKRAVPSLWIQRGLDPKYIEACEYFWKALSDDTPTPLVPLD